MSRQKEDKHQQKRWLRYADGAEAVWQNFRAVDSSSMKSKNLRGSSRFVARSQTSNEPAWLSCRPTRLYAGKELRKTLVIVTTECGYASSLSTLLGNGKIQDGAETLLVNVTLAAQLTGRRTREMHWQGWQPEPSKRSIVISIESASGLQATGSGIEGNRQKQTSQRRATDQR